MFAFWAADTCLETIITGGKLMCSFDHEEEDELLD